MNKLGLKIRMTWWYIFDRDTYTKVKIFKRSVKKALRNPEVTKIIKNHLKSYIKM